MEFRLPVRNRLGIPDDHIARQGHTPALIQTVLIRTRLEEDIVRRLSVVHIRQWRLD